VTHSIAYVQDLLARYRSSCVTLEELRKRVESHLLAARGGTYGMGRPPFPMAVVDIHIGGGTVEVELEALVGAVRAAKERLADELRAAGVEPQALVESTL